jgi:hypothetical protein
LTPAGGFASSTHTVRSGSVGSSLRRGWVQGEGAVTHRQRRLLSRLAALARHADGQHPLDRAGTRRVAQQFLGPDDAATQLGPDQRVLAGPTRNGEIVVEVALAVGDPHDGAVGGQGGDAGGFGVEPALRFLVGRFFASAILALAAFGGQARAE